MRAQKWFTGEAWASFCAGERGSPGGPIAIATLVLLVAEDMQKQGTCKEPEAQPLLALTTQPDTTQPDTAERGGRRRRGRGRDSYTRRASSSMVSTNTGPEPDAQQEAEDDQEPPAIATLAHLQFIPTQMEEKCDAADLDIIRELFGSRAQTIINILLAFNAYFAWYYPLKQSIPFLAPMAVREARALENCRAAIDMHEAFERVSMRNHGSFLPHAAIFKVTSDILRVGDVYAVNLSPLELHNADTKRTADRSATRRMCTSSAGETRRP